VGSTISKFLEDWRIQECVTHDQINDVTTPISGSVLKYLLGIGSK
jgi:hypothetical protein